MNYRSNYTAEERTTAFSFPKEKDLKIRFVNRKDWEPFLDIYIYASNILQKNITKKVKIVNVTA